MPEMRAVTIRTVETVALTNTGLARFRAEMLDLTQYLNKHPDRLKQMRRAWWAIQDTPGAKNVTINAAGDVRFRVETHPIDNRQAVIEAMTDRINIALRTV